MSARSAVRRRWSPDLADHLPAFRAYAEERGLERVGIALEPEDFYLFCSEKIHEVPEPRGDRPRIVLACFFAMSEEDEEIFVWS